jgi:hypothetical protein
VTAPSQPLPPVLILIFFTFLNLTRLLFRSPTGIPGSHATGTVTVTVLNYDFDHAQK